MIEDELLENEDEETTIDEEDVPLEDEQEDEEIEDDLEEDSEESEEDSEEETEDNAVVVNYVDANGREVEEEMSYDQISEYISLGKSLNKKDIEYAQNAKPIIEKIQTSEILQQFLYYKLNSNWSDDQILWGMFKQKFEKPKEEEKKEFNTVDEEIEYKVEQKVKKETEGTKRELEEIRYERAKEKAYKNNNELLSNALTENGYTGRMTEELQTLMVDSLQTIVNGNVDYNIHELTPKQAKAIVKLALSEMKGTPKLKTNNKTVISKNIERQNKAPKVLDNIGINKKKLAEREEFSGNTMAARAANWKKMFS